MIPHVFHRVWVGSEPIPEKYEDWWRAFQEMHPSWGFETWTDERLGWLRNMQLFNGAKTPSERSDIARYEVLQKFGGVYIDTDVEPIRSFDTILAPHITAFAGWEYSHRLCTAVMGAEPGHPAVEKLVLSLPGWVKQHDKQPPDRRTGPLFLTTMWWKLGVERFHREVFYPVGWWERERLGGPYPKRTVAVHHWAGSWIERGDEEVGTPD